MISVIVPVYKVETYLRQCVDSIINQTYRDLEILLIDDCSPDSCGEICDEYAKKDNRIRVFHLEKNRGLSIARNKGLDEARGKYIGFVDSDDWIEPEMYESLYREIVAADIVECRESTRKKDKEIYNTKEAMIALLDEKINNTVWNKLFRSSVFDKIRFPENRNFEDISIMHKLIGEASTVIVLNKSVYRYRKRIDGISQNHSAKNLINYADAYLERYWFFFVGHPEIFSEHQVEIIRGCIKGNAWVWRWWYGCSDSDKKDYEERIEELKQFARKHFSISILRKLPFFYRMVTIFLKLNNKVVFWILFQINKFYLDERVTIRNFV